MIDEFGFNNSQITGNFASQPSIIPVEPEPETIVVSAKFMDDLINTVSFLERRITYHQEQFNRIDETLKRFGIS